MVPSFSMISQITAAGYKLVSLQRSTAASVWPFLSLTPPFFARTGKRWPGLMKSAGFDAGLVINWAVMDLSNADIPVLVPCSFTASIASRNAV